MSAELESARQASLRMHVAEVAPTDALFREPVRAFNGGSACWRVAIRDARNRPVAAARVQIDVVTPDGAVRGRTTAMSGSDGLALFTYPLEEGETDGVYTVRVVHVSHVTHGDVTYDPAADTARSASFSVSRPGKPRTPPSPRREAKGSR
jgi:hypothetical protein